MKKMGRVEGPGFVGSFLTPGMMGAVILAAIVLGSGTPARAQNEKRTVFTENDFHWQGNLKEGQTLEVINRNGNIDASSATGGAAQVGGTKHEGDENDFFIEVVEYSDGVTICAVYAKDKTPGRCHRGGVSSESSNWNWHGHRAKIYFEVNVPHGWRQTALMNNGDEHGNDMQCCVNA